MRGPERLRVAFIAGTLGQAGAEKQMVYMVRALSGLPCAVRVYSLTRGEFYEPVLGSFGVMPEWFGARRHPALRVARLAAALRGFRPHVVQAAHAFTNFYAVLAGRAAGALRIGALRDEPSDVAKAHGRVTSWLFRAPDALIVNSKAASKRLVEAWGMRADGIYWVPNCIDPAPFEASRPRSPGSWVTAAFAGRLIPRKRLDVFLRALALAKRREPSLRGLVIGDGPERQRMETLASELRLTPPDVTFAGKREDVPALLGESDMFVLSSDSEGTPNVVLEAMAARLPVITTPAGDAALIAKHLKTGFVVAPGDYAAIADRLVELARDPQLRRAMGAAGRAEVELQFGLAPLAGRLLEVYRAVAERKGDRRALKALSNCRAADRHPELVSGAVL